MIPKYKWAWVLYAIVGTGISAVIAWYAWHDEMHLVWKILISAWCFEDAVERVIKAYGKYTGKGPFIL